MLPDIKLEHNGQTVMCIENSNGPKIDSCETPETTTKFLLNKIPKRILYSRHIGYYLLVYFIICLIFFLFIHILYENFNNESLPYFFEWFGPFKCGEMISEDGSRSGRPSTFPNDENVKKNCLKH